METVGWFDPESGYWETDGVPAQKYIDAYPEGAYMTDGLKPTNDHEWDHETKAWVYARPTITSGLINRVRDDLIRAGVTVNLDVNTSVLVEGDEASKLNLTNLGLAAQGRMGATDNTPFQYRDGNNVTHTLTPPEMFKVWQESIQHVEKIYSASWDLKAMDPVPLDYADAKYWP